MKFKNISIICIIFIMSGCSFPVLKIPQEINKLDSIKGLVLPFEDFTKQYNTEYQVERDIVDKINNNFKGILINRKRYSEKPRFYKIPNPYFFEYIPSDSLEFKNLKTDDIIKRISPDIIVRGKIETMQFGKIDKKLIESYFAFGVIGALVEDIRKRNKVQGFVAIRTEVINVKTNETIIQEVITGISKPGERNKLTMHEAYKQAFNNYAENVLLMLSDKK